MSDTDLMHRIAVLERKAERERQARKLAESLLERKSLELYTAKVEAEMANRMKSEFLANMSHELRTPLNAVIGFAELICAEALGPVGRPQYLAYAGDIRDSGRHLLALINDILDLAKIEAGHLVLDDRTVEMAETLETCVRMVRPRAEKAGIELVVSLARDVPMIRADDTRLRQVVLNLLANAIKFTPAGGRVTLSVAPDGDGNLLIAVMDTGIGIAEADLPRVLQPFVQADGGLSRMREGTGLGLPLSKRLVELHGGALHLRSSPGAGTTVTVRLPVERVLRIAA